MNVVDMASKETYNIIPTSCHTCMEKIGPCSIGIAICEGQLTGMRVKDLIGHEVVVKCDRGARKAVVSFNGRYLILGVK